MRLCSLCWKNLKQEPANILYKEGKKPYIICNKCRTTKLVAKMLQNGWNLILTSPNLNER